MTDTPATAPAVTDSAATALYAVLARQAEEGAVLSTLHIGGSRTCVASGTITDAGETPSTYHAVAVGTRVMAALHLTHEPALAEDIERAMAAAFAAFAPLREAFAPGLELCTADACIRQVALAAGVQARPQMQLSLAQVQQAFERLRGNAPDAEPLPPQAGFAATLVILRACMLELGFARIVIGSDAAA